MNIRTDLSGRLKDGRQLVRASYRDEEKSKLGNLRAGNSGIMSEEGEVAGSCHRIAHLRSLGIEIDPPDDSKLIMFQMGTANEQIVFDDLLETATDDEVILREHEIPIQWFTSNGTKVTGRPDMVICRKVYEPEGENPPAGFYVAEGVPRTLTPVFGIELKSIASVWTSRDVIGEQVPKMENLIQSAHYSWKLGIPFRLMYKQYSIQEIPFWKGSGDAPGWGQKLFPKRNAPGSEHIDYERGRVQPFEIVYELEFSGGTTGRLRYRKEGNTDWVPTLITTEDIERFYEFTANMAASKDLGGRPMTIGPSGKAKSWNRCDPKYCDLAGVCGSHEKAGYVKWLEEVRKTMGTP